MLATAVLGLDLGEAKWGITRDFDELTLYGPVGWAIVCAIVGLPLGSILVLVFRRRLLALVPLGISVILFVLWGLYYATDWWSNPGQGGWPPALGLFALGWLVLLVSALTRPGWLNDL